MGATAPALARLVRRFVADRSGATAIEYGLIACFIFLAVIGVVTAVGVDLQQPFNVAKSALD
jgi:pilus assembly protein Flp/PilA